MVGTQAIEIVLTSIFLLMCAAGNSQGGSKAAPPTQLLIYHMGSEDRPVPRLVLFVRGSETLQLLPPDCPKAARCLPVEPSRWREMAALAQSALERHGAQTDTGRLGTFQFTLIAGKSSVERILAPRQSAAVLSKLAELAGPNGELRRELRSRASLAAASQPGNHPEAGF